LSPAGPQNPSLRGRLAFLDNNLYHAIEGDA
jgi:hypothetical protein